ncbi:unnamed protein product [Protopolystoma xenopodis]|uniref:Uncharacterized protein n=1 Tax=Protopolystoma xenopodis TaxID=117903 RepID=A0A3S5BQF7_9PLAT|nr:unnamed protein product [Protopolystoma xenopodis]
MWDMHYPSNSRTAWVSCGARPLCLFIACAPVATSLFGLIDYGQRFGRAWIGENRPVMSEQVVDAKA